MIRVYVVVEGATEEAFVRDVLGPTLCMQSVLLIPRIIGAAGHQGGRVSYDRAKHDISHFLKQERGAFCTTMFDFYGLGSGFTKSLLPTGLANREKVARIEAAVKSDLAGSLPESLRVDVRFLPYLQLHEYEGLLFSDPDAFALAIDEPRLMPQFRRIRGEFATPEDIDDGLQSAPSKRVAAAFASYDKVLHGVLAAKSVGIAAMRRECPHFNQWVASLERLATP